MSCYLYVIIHLDDDCFSWVVSVTDMTYSTRDVPLRGSIWRSSSVVHSPVDFKVGIHHITSACFIGNATQWIRFRDNLDGTTEGAEHFHVVLGKGLFNKSYTFTFLISHRLPKPLSEGGSIKIPPACSVNVVNSLLSLLMDTISHTYISLKVL